MTNETQALSDQVVSGQVVFARGGAWAGAVVRVRVDDLSHERAMPSVVAQIDLPLHRAVNPGFAMPFRMVVPLVDAQHRYALSVHVDQSGSGQVQTGDKISSRDYAVLEHGAACEVTVEMVPVETD